MNTPQRPGRGRNAARPEPAATAPPGHLVPAVLHQSLPAALEDAAGIPARLGWWPDRAIAFAVRRPGAPGPDVRTVGIPDGRWPHPGPAVMAGPLSAGSTVSVIGFGPGGVTDGPARAAARELAAAGSRVTGVLRITRGQARCLCGGRSCKPLPLPPGAAFAIPGTSAEVGPLAGAAARAVQESAKAAWAASRGRSGGGEHGRRAVRDALARCRTDGTLPGPGPAGEIIALLRFRDVRGYAVSLLDQADLPVHRRLWTGLARLAPDRFRVSPYILLAQTAWRQGDGDLGCAALACAQRDNPAHPWVQFLCHSLDAGMLPPPGRTPEM